MIKLRIVPNVFEDEGRSTKNLSYCTGCSLLGYLDGVDLQDQKFIVNGVVVDNFSVVLADNSEIIVTPNIEEPVSIIIALAAFIKAYAVYITLAMAAYSLYVYFTSKPLDIPKVKKSSPTYGWDGIFSTQDVDRPVPIIYGEHRIGGNRINLFTQGETQTDYGWEEGTPVSIVNVNHVNIFRTSKSCTGVQFVLDEKKLDLVYSAGDGVRTAKGCFRDCSGVANTGGEQFARYRVSYKKASDSTYTILHNVFKEGLVVTPLLSDAVYDVKIELDVSDIVGFESSDSYYNYTGTQKELKYFTTDGRTQVPLNKESQFLNVLLALGEGEVEDIREVYIDDSPLENFAQGGARMSMSYRKGTTDQSIISAFGDLHDLKRPVGNEPVQVTNSGPLTYGTSQAIEAFEIHFSLPAFYFQKQSTGSLRPASLTYGVEYQPNKIGAYIDLGQFTITELSTAAIRRIFRKEGLPLAEYNIRITNFSPPSTAYWHFDFYVDYIDEITLEDLAYPFTALAGLKFLATEQLSGMVPNTTFLVRGRKVSVPKIMCAGVELSYDEYYHDGTTYRKWDGTAATWDGTTWVDRWTANPVWIFQDMLVNDRFGLGQFISTSSFVESYLIAMANYCDEMVPAGLVEGVTEKRFRLDVVLDTQQKALDLIQMLVFTFRGMALYSGGRIKMRIDKPESATQLFTMGNIVEGSFGESFKSIKDSPNCIQVNYLDDDERYNQETVQVTDSDALVAGDPLRKSELSLYGVTRRSQAVREARYFLNVSKYIVRSVTFKAGIDAVVCMGGDVIEFAHDVPQWGFSGRITNQSPSKSVLLDQSVILNSDTVYSIRVRHKYDTIATRQIDSDAANRTVSEITSDMMSSLFDSDVQNYDLYSIGIFSVVTKPFRIMSMQRDNKQEVTIIASEYNATIYDERWFTKPTSNYSMLDLSVSHITDAVATERLVLRLDGTIETAIDVYWLIPPIKSGYVKPYGGARIYISTDDGETWEFDGEAKDNTYTFYVGADEVEAFYIKIVAVSIGGEEANFSTAPTTSIIVYGKTTAPENVQSFDVNQVDNVLYFSWDAVSDVDVRHYRIKKGPTWAEATTILEVVDATKTQALVTDVGWLWFWIVAVDTSGNESLSPAYDIVEVISPSSASALNEFDFWAQDLKIGHSSELALEYANYYDAGYVRQVLTVNTETMWEELEIEDKGWYELLEEGRLFLDSDVVVSEQEFTMREPIEFTMAFSFQVIVDADYTNISGGLFTLQISTSLDGVTYTDFVDVSDAFYVARYVKYRVQLQTTNAVNDIRLYGLGIVHYAPQRLFSEGKDIAIDSVSGKTLLFGVDFTVAPAVIVTIVNGIAGVAVVSSKTADDFKVTCYDLAGVAIDTAEIDYRAEGV